MDALSLSPKAMKQPSIDHTPSTPIKEAVGSVVGCSNYLKLYDTLKSSFTNHKVLLLPGATYNVLYHTPSIALYLHKPSFLHCQ